MALGVNRRGPMVCGASLRANAGSMEATGGRVVTAGLPTARAYDLRHFFVSLLIHEGQSILEVARQAGHSPQTCLRDYGHLFDDFDPAKRERRRR